MTTKAPTVRAGELARELNSATDELNKTLAKAEAAIAALGLGVSTKVVLDEDEHTVTYLRWGKWGQSWQLYAELDMPNQDEESEYTPLKSASR